MTDAQLISVCQAICARLRKYRPRELWTEHGPTPLAQDLLAKDSLSSGERVLFHVAWAVWNSDATPLTLGDVLSKLYGEDLAFVGSLLVAMGGGSEAVSRWLKLQGVPHAR